MVSDLGSNVQIYTSVLVGVENPCHFDANL